MQRSRREILKLAGVGALGASLDPGALLRAFDGEGPDDERPNILFIMTDQQRWDTLSCVGNSVISTPHLDRLAKSGALFSEMTCTSPVCGPSRAAVLSGRIFRGHGCNGSVKQFAENKDGLKDKIETFDETLHAAGYRTEYIGKWHTGPGHQEVYESGLKTHFLKHYEAEMRAKYPLSQADRQLPVDGYTGMPYHPYPLKGMMAKGDMRHRGRENQPKIHHDPEAGWSDIAEEDSLTAWLSKRSIEFLKQKHDRPFALTCSILHPHAPLITNGRYTDMFDPAEMPMPENVFDDESRGQFGVPSVVPAKPAGLGRFIAQYMALIVEIDDWVGRLLDTLEEQGLRENTIVIFTSDHGEMMGSHGQVGKSRSFEEAIRIPMLLSLPGRIAPGLVRNQPVSGIDIAPTLLDYCGVPTKEGRFDGVSMRSAIEEQSFPRELAPLELNRMGMRMRGIRSSAWKFSISERYGQRLYNLEEDPLEKLNLIGPDSPDRSKYLTVAHARRDEAMEFFGDHRDYLLRELPALH